MENVCGCLLPLSFSISYTSTSSNCVATWNNGQCDSCNVESAEYMDVCLVTGLPSCSQLAQWGEAVLMSGLETYKHFCRVYWGRLKVLNLGLWFLLNVSSVYTLQIRHREFSEMDESTFVATIWSDAFNAALIHILILTVDQKIMCQVR